MKGSKKSLAKYAVYLHTENYACVAAGDIGPGSFQDPEEAAKAERRHIYLICRHPMMSFLPEEFRFENGVVRGTVSYRVSGELRTLPFSSKYQLSDEGVSLSVSSYPHRELEEFDTKGNKIRRMPASFVGHKVGRGNAVPEICETEVLYIGQAFGDGNKSALERLSSHSTLQKILARTHLDFSDDEVFLWTFEYSNYSVVTLMEGGGGSSFDQTTEEERFYSVHENPLSEREQICLTEAGLIRYFQPQYNVVYKEKFPSEKHKILARLYDLDFSALSVEIDAGESGCSFYSGTVQPRKAHVAKFELHEKNERRNFFLFRNADGSHSEWGNPIFGP